MSKKLKFFLSTVVATWVVMTSCVDEKQDIDNNEGNRTINLELNEENVEVRTLAVNANGFNVIV
ncbi:MAG: hypothetical protein ABJF04_12495 [Reichenbachiella sp.]|uniref:hypothetical protein n=1 Tax=Reichenbachiella sp. TaxID=2184521 RepID=UPI0032635E3A